MKVESPCDEKLMVKRSSVQARKGHASASLATRGALAAGMAVILLILTFAMILTSRLAPVRTIGGPFALMAHDRRAVSETDFLGRPFLVFFGYTHCQDICRMTLSEISETLRALGPGAKIRAAFVTVDPERDTPDAFKDYLANFAPRIIGLTGEGEAVASMLRAYQVYSKRVNGSRGDYGIDHTLAVYLMGEEGQFVKRLDVSSQPNDLARELQPYLRS